MNHATYYQSSVTNPIITPPTFVSLWRFIHIAKNFKMKTRLLTTLTAAFLLLIPNAIFGQSITLGTAANFVLFSTNGAVSNTGISQLTGNIGTNNGSSTAFGNVNGVMHDNDGASAKCAGDLLIAYNQLNAAIPTDFIAPLIGNGATLFAGVYSVPSAATLSSELTLDAKNDPNAQFIFKINGSFSTNAASKIILLNGALACNVFWKIEGLVSLATATSLKGTVIANNAAIKMSTGAKLEGRALSTAGAITVDGLLAYTPVGCGSVTLSGPTAPDLASAECYVLFSSNGAVTNTGITTLKGDVGTNVGLTTGFNTLLVDGFIHPIPDLSTAQCAADLIKVYTFLNILPNDIELLYPAQFGRGLVLTPHTYLMNAAAVLTDTVFLNAQGNADAVFVIKINGALTTSTYANVVLINGAQSKNVYWKIEGAVDISNYSTLRGTIVTNNGALGALNTGVVLDGRALTTTGALTSTAMIGIQPTVCKKTAVESIQADYNAVTIAPNPISSTTTITLNGDNKATNYKLVLYNSLGKEVINTTLTQQKTALNSKELYAGIYFFKIMNNDKLIQSGKLISKQ